MEPIFSIATFYKHDAPMEQNPSIRKYINFGCCISVAEVHLHPTLQAKFELLPFTGVTTQDLLFRVINLHKIHPIDFI